MKAEEEARKWAEKEAKMRKEEAKMRAEEAKITAEKEAKKRAEKEAKIKAENEARKWAEEEAKIRAKEEAKMRAEEEAKIRAEKEAKKRAEEEARIRTENEARKRKEEEARTKAEEEAKKIAEEEARISADNEEEARLRKEEEERIREEENESKSNENVNMIRNGDFENGEVTPWSCKQAQCDASKQYLSVSKIAKNWAGPRQFLSTENFSSNNDLNITFKFSIKSSQPITSKWNIRATLPTENTNKNYKYFSIFKQNIQNQGWIHFSEFLTLPNTILGAKEIMIYMEEPQKLDYSLDNIILKKAEVIIEKEISGKTTGQRSLELNIIKPKCESAKDCKSVGLEGHNCYKGKCTESCDGDSNCNYGEYCHVDHKVCHEFCKSTSDCSGGYTCYDSKCYKDCYGEEECGFEQYCDEYVLFATTQFALYQIAWPTYVSRLGTIM